MGSDAGWKVEGPRENITIIKKGFKKALLFCKKVGGGHGPQPHLRRRPWRRLLEGDVDGKHVFAR